MVSDQERHHSFLGFIPNPLWASLHVSSLTALLPNWRASPSFSVFVAESTYPSLNSDALQLLPKLNGKLPRSCIPLGLIIIT